MVKKAYSIDEQIDLLSKRGMEFDNIPKAKEILADIGYYRFGFFSFPFEKSYPNKINRTHEVVPGTTFKQVHDLYVFDSQLRFILTKALTRIEVNIRTRITYKGSMYYINDPWWFCNSSYIKAGYLNKFDREVYDAVRKNPAIQEHHKKHNRDKYAPAWKTIEFMTIGNIITLYDSLKEPEAKDLVANAYGCSRGVFFNYLETIRVLRNKCAHGGCIYRMDFPKGIKRLPADISADCRHNIKGGIDVVRYMLGCISQNRKTDLENEIYNLVSSIQTTEAKNIIAQTSKLEY